MRVPDCCRWSLCPALLLGVWLAAPAVAHASCGSYVVIGGQPTHAHTPAGLMPSAAPDGQALALPVPPQPLCNGPFCSAPVAPAPVAPVPAPSPTAVEQWGWLETGMSSEAPRPGSWLRDPEALHPVARPNSIFHPPRLGRTTSV